MVSWPNPRNALSVISAASDPVTILLETAPLPLVVLVATGLSVKSCWFHVVHLFSHLVFHSANMNQVSLLHNTRPCGCGSDQDRRDRRGPCSHGTYSPNGE